MHVFLSQNRSDNQYEIILVRSKVMWCSSCYFHKTMCVRNTSITAVFFFFFFIFLRNASMLTNGLIIWLHKIANNCMCMRFSFQPTRTAIPIRVSLSLRVRMRLPFKPMKTAFSERVLTSFRLAPSFIAYAV